jgi:hypothetical protein
MYAVYWRNRRIVPMSTRPLVAMSKGVLVGRSAPGFVELYIAVPHNGRARDKAYAGRIRTKKAMRMNRSAREDPYLVSFGWRGNSRNFEKCLCTGWLFRVHGLLCHCIVRRKHSRSRFLMFLQERTATYLI